MRLRPTLLVAAREVKEALRSRWFLLAAASFLLLSLGLSALGLSGSQRSGLAGFDRTTASLLNLALMFVPLLTLSIGGLSLAGELEDGVLGFLLSQPLSRLEVFVGKYLGLSAALFSAVLLGFGSSGLLVGVVSGGSARAFVFLVGLTLLLSAATLAVGAMLSALFRTRAKVVGAAFVAWLGFVYLSDLGTIGVIAARELSAGRLFALALVNPVQQARVLGTLALSDRLDLLGPVGLFGQDTFGTGGLVAFLITCLLAIAVAALAVGYRSFRKAVVP